MNRRTGKQLLQKSGDLAKRLRRFAIFCVASFIFVISLHLELPLILTIIAGIILFLITLLSIVITLLSIAMPQIWNGAQGVVALAWIIQKLFPKFLPCLQTKGRSLWKNITYNWPISLYHSRPILGHAGFSGTMYFTGRDEFLENIHLALHSQVSSAKKPPLTIVGRSGSGKTEVVYAYAIYNHRSYSKILWLNASSPDTLISSCKKILDTGELNSKDQVTDGQPGNPGSIDVVKRWLQTNKNWLLILDRCGDLSNNTGQNNPASPTLRELLEEFIAQTQYNGYILITANELVLPPFINTTFRLPEWEEEDAALFLLRRIGKLKHHDSLTKAYDDDLQLSREIARYLEKFPLALEFAGALIAENGWSLADYRREYEADKVKLLQLAPSYIPQGFSRSLAESLLAFFNAMQKESPLAGRLLQMCSFLASAPMPQEIIITASTFIDSSPADEQAVKKAFAILSKFSFVMREEETRTLTVRQLIQVMIKNEMDKSTQQELAVIAVRALNDAFTKAQFEDWQQLRFYLPHVHVCAGYIKTIPIESKEAVQLLNLSAHYLQEYAQYSEAQQMLDQACELCETMEAKGTLSQNSLELATCLKYQGELYHTLGRYQFAQDRYEQALACYPGVLHVTTVLNDLGMLFDDWRELTTPDRRSGYRQQAVDRYQDALNIRHQKLDSSAICTLMFILSNLAWSYYEYNELEQAKALLKIAQDAFQQILGTAPAEMPESLWHICEQIFTGVLAVFKHIFQAKYGYDEHPYIAQCYTHLGALYAMHSEHKERNKAQQYYGEAVGIGKKYLGRSHPSVARWLNNLAEQYHCQGKYEEAKNLYQQALDIYLYRQTLGEMHTSLLYLRNNYAKLPSGIVTTRDVTRYEEIDPVKFRERARQITMEGTRSGIPKST